MKRRMTLTLLATALLTIPTLGAPEGWHWQAGKGETSETAGALQVKGEARVRHVASPMAQDGEVEVAFELLNDEGQFGILFRAGEDGAWQGLFNAESARHLYHTAQWEFRSAEGKPTPLFTDGTAMLRRSAGVDVTLKVRFEGKALTVWMDGSPIHSGEVPTMAPRVGHVGIVTGPKAEVLVKRLTFRPLPEAALAAHAAAQPKSGTPVCLVRDGLSVTLSPHFPAMRWAGRQWKVAGRRVSVRPSTAQTGRPPRD